MLKENREWFYILLILVVVLGALYLNNIDKVAEPSSTITADELCREGSGFWNECGSACAGKNVDFCTEQCVQQCECGFENYKCPEEYECIQEEGTHRGVCKKESE